MAKRRVKVENKVSSNNSKLLWWIIGIIVLILIVIAFYFSGNITGNDVGVPAEGVPKVDCTDTDGGSIYIKGQIIDSDNNVFAEDKCKDSLTLNEYSCGGGVIIIYGCNQTSCGKQPATRVDTIYCKCVDGMCKAKPKNSALCALFPSFRKCKMIASSAAPVNPTNSTNQTG